MRITFRDPSLPHQIILLHQSGSAKIAMSCNCLASRNENATVSHKPIESRALWEPGAAYTAWLDWHVERAIDPMEVAA